MDYNKIDLTGIKAILFDCDGTLADTMGAHKKAYEIAFDLCNVFFNEARFNKYAPLGGEEYKRHILYSGVTDEEGWERIVRTKKEILPPVLRKYMKPNVELIKFLNESIYKRVRVGIVSNGRIENIKNIIDMLQIYPEVLICKEHVTRPKPQPDPYIIAMSAMKVKPSEVIVFEDNEIGITSALGAGVAQVIEVKM